MLIFDPNWPFCKAYNLAKMAYFQNRLISWIFGVFWSGFFCTELLYCSRRISIFDPNWAFCKAYSLGKAMYVRFSMLKYHGIKQESDHWAKIWRKPPRFDTSRGTFLSLPCFLVIQLFWFVFFCFVPKQKFLVTNSGKKLVLLLSFFFPLLASVTVRKRLLWF